MAQVNQLSNREREVVQLLLQGKSNKLIALSLCLSIRTVEFHLKNVFAKFQVSSRVEFILRLWNTAAGDQIEKLGYSTVDRSWENTENRGEFDPRMDLATSFRDSVSIIAKEYPMTTANAFVRLFPPALFLIVGLFLSSFWSPDPVLFILALIAAGMCAAWLIIVSVEVVKLLRVESSPLPTAPASASLTAK